MSNSKLVTYTKISPHRTVGNFKKTKFTIHHMAGILTVEQCGNVFQNREASTNYGVDAYGHIGMYVEEKDRAWATANYDNDCQSINIEVANDGGASTNWHVSDKAIATLIELMAECAKRNGINKLVYDGTKNGNVTTHDMFMATTCPGGYLKSKIPYIVAEVNMRLMSKEPKPPQEEKEASKKETRTNVQLACAVWQGEFGNGAERKKALGDRYDKVQALVDRGVGMSKNSAVTNEALADEIMQGLWGNGSDRRKKLEANGFNYEAVQKTVNNKYY